MLALPASNIKKVQPAVHRRDAIYPLPSLGYTTVPGSGSGFLVFIRFQN